MKAAAAATFRFIYDEPLGYQEPDGGHGIVAFIRWHFVVLSSTLTVAGLNLAKMTQPSSLKRRHFYLNADNNWLSFARTS